MSVVVLHTDNELTKCYSSQDSNVIRDACACIHVVTLYLSHVTREPTCAKNANAEVHM